MLRKMMVLAALGAALAGALAGTPLDDAAGQRVCRGVYFRGEYYDVRLVKDGVNRARHLALDRRRDTLYFTVEQIARVPATDLAYLRLATADAGLVGGVRNASGLAVDHQRDRLYAGGADGLFLVNEQGVPVKLPVDDRVRSVFFKDVLYFTNGRGEANVFEDGHVRPVPELRGVEVDELVVDDEGAFVVARGGALFRVARGSRAVQRHELRAAALAVDRFHVPYAAAADGVYVYNKYKLAWDRAARWRNVRGLAFNEFNEPVYAVQDSIVKLTHNPVKCRDY